MRAGDGGDLDGDVVDVVTAQQPLGLAQAPLGLGIAQHGLSEQVDVELVASGGQVLDGGAELLVPGVHDQVPDHLAQGPPGQRDGRPGGLGRHQPAGAHGGAQVPGQELRDDRGQAPEVVPGRGVVLRADHAVDEADGELQAVRVLQDPGQLLGGLVLRDLGGGLDPAGDQLTGLLGQALELGGVEGVGGHGDSSSRSRRGDPAGHGAQRAVRRVLGSSMVENTMKQK
ncbi:Uncharacterised protein [Mycobacteroides abscessus subsp. abscessus]|nr:Uncharacterised protein [Mycobacteroides abscessus subsp. abscessus]